MFNGRVSVRGHPLSNLEKYRNLPTVRLKFNYLRKFRYFQGGFRY